MTIKTGTITFHCSLNFGSVLQTFALQKMQQKLGVDNEVINYIYDNDARRYELFRTHLYKSNPLYFVADLLTLSMTKRRKAAYDKFNERFIRTTEEEFHESEEIRKIVDRYDAVICGSDQIWNTYATKQVVPAFFLDFAKDSDKLRVAYAPSLGRATIESQNIDDFEYYLRNIDRISVREKSSVLVVKQLTDKEVMQVLDPVLLLETNDYDEIITPVDIDGKYIFYYALEKNRTITEYVAKLAENSGFTVVYFSKWKLPFKKGFNIFTCDPGQYLYLLKNAEYVVTNSFHGTAFSVLFQKQFVTFTTQHSYPRMVDLLKIIGLEDRIQKGKLDINSIIDYEYVQEQLIKEKEKSIAYLINSLKRKS